MRRFLKQLRALRARARYEQDLQDELDAHVRMDVRERIEAGDSLLTAEECTRRDFGNRLRIEEDTRNAWGWSWLETLFVDLRFSFRMFLKNPGFTILAVFTLALGIAGNTSMFSVVNGLLFEPLPYKDAGRLMVITELDERSGEPQRGGLSYVNAADWFDQQHTFSDLALFRAPVPFRAQTPTGPSIMSIRMVSAEFFSLLGTTPVVGRDFTGNDDRPGAPPTIVLSYGAWLRHFSGFLTNVKEYSIEIDRQRYSVIGVLPRDFTFYGASDGYIPIRLSREPWTTDRQRRPNVMALGRLRGDVTREQAQSDLQAIAHQLARLYPQANRNRGAAVTPILDDMVGKDIRSTIYLLFAGVGCVLLIACSNVACLLLARGSARQKEIALRCSLGAGRRRVMRQLMIENLLLGLLGGVEGLFLAIAATDLIVVAAPGGLPRIESVGIHWPVLVFSFVISVIAAALFGLAPAWHAVRMEANAILKEGSTPDFRRQRFLALLAISEVALTLMLVVAAGLVLRSTINAMKIDPGFQPEGIFSFALAISPNDYATGKEVHDVYRTIEEDLRSVPGVEAASIAIGNLPKPVAVSREYLRLTGIHLLAGRFFDEADTLTSRPVIVIDDVMAKARFPDVSPIGRLLEMDESFGLEAPRREVIGVVNHVAQFGIESESEVGALGHFYLSTEQVPDQVYEGAPGGLMMLIRSNVESVSTLTSSPFRNGIRQRSLVPDVVHRLDPNLEIGRATAMKDAVERAMAPRRFAARVLNVFALVAIALAAVGIYGMTAYTVTRRTQEIGVRVALGANKQHIVKMVVRHAGRLAVTGIVVGLFGSFALAQYVTHLMFGISVSDPFTYAVCAALLLVVALVAAYIPASRVLRLSPVSALRGDFSTIAASAGLHPVQRLPIDVGRRVFTPGSAPPVIETHGLNKTFQSFRGKSVTALSDISIRVEEGTIFGLIGQNGAGKSTLVKILLGLSRPTNGSAKMLGCRPGDPVARRRVGYLPEAMRIPDHFSGYDFVHYMGRLNGVDRALLRDRIPKLLARVGLEGVEKPVKNYSKGMQQRLGLAQALINDPEILFLDEPTDGLDPLGRIEVRDLLVELRAQGKTIFLNSHLLSEIELVCDQIVILDKGVVARTTNPQEFTRGTGEYIMRISPINNEARALVESLVGPCTWAEDSLRFKPRDIAQLNELIRALQQTGVQIIAVEPLRSSLEKFFIEVVSERGNRP